MAVIPAPPRVSVLIAVHNGASHLREAIDSVMAQTWPDFELVVVDDASTDATPAILAGLADPRLRLLRTERNLGAAGARNLGFDHCRGEYLAILDHDDLCYPARLATQVAYLDRNPRLVLVGSEVHILRGGRLHVPDHPPGGAPLLMRWRLHLDNPLTFSSVTMRMDAVRRLGTFLRPGLSEDYDLYHRLLRVGDIARLDEVLTAWRAHAANVSAAAPDAMLRGAVAVLADAVAPWVGEDAAPGAASLVIRHLSERRPVTGAAELARLGAVLEQMASGFCAGHAATPEDRTMIWAEAGRSWWQAARAGARNGQPGLLRGWQARPALRRGFRPSRADIAVTFGLGSARGLAGKWRGTSGDGRTDR